MSSLTALRIPAHHSAPAANCLLTTTVPREYVHRAAVSEVLLTGWGPDPLAGRDQSDSNVVRARWGGGGGRGAPAGGG
ncbi:gamma-butyrolactone biosynthesis enzyme, partial [Streptomyces goshikiensis]